MDGVTDVPGYGLEDSLLTRFEYQAHKHPEGPSLLLELQRASSIATQRLVNLRLEFKNVVVLQSYADFQFWLDDSLLHGLQRWDDLPAELAGSWSSRGPYIELNTELVGQLRGITVADSRESQRLRRISLTRSASTL